MESQMELAIRYMYVARGITRRFWARPYAVAALIIASASISRGDQELWKKCTTATTDYTLQVPASLLPASGPGVTGCVYQSADGEFNVEAAEQPDTQPLEAR